MSKPDYKPVPRVRMTLTGAIQDRCLHELCTAFGVGEYYSQTHEITCFPSDFAYFMDLVAKMDKPPTLKQLRVEYVDIRNDVRRTTVQSQNRKWNCEEVLEEPELEPNPSVEGRIPLDVNIIRAYPLAEAMWWFIENVGQDHPARDELFFLLRERVRVGQDATD